MFEMSKHLSKDDMGYFLKISYIKKLEKFYLEGYHIPTPYSHSLDGGTLLFDSLEEVLDYIKNYRES